MEELTVGKLIEMLQTLDTETKVHYHRGGGEFPPIVQNPENKDPYSKQFGLIELAKFDSLDEDYYATTSDDFYKKNKKQYGKPFKALVIM